MKAKIIASVFFLFTLFACFETRLPKDILPEKQLIPILVDMHLAEAINSQKYNLSLTRDSLPEDLYLSICQKHRVDRSMLEKTLLFYGKHPREYLPLYNQVLNKLSEIQLKSRNDTTKKSSPAGFDPEKPEMNKSSVPAATPSTTGN